nr:MAG TPA: hypothetical protein [Caudoviricetes sp.]
MAQNGVPNFPINTREVSLVPLILVFLKTIVLKNLKPIIKQHQ